MIINWGGLVFLLIWGFIVFVGSCIDRQNLKIRRSIFIVMMACMLSNDFIYLSSKNAAWLYIGRGIIAILLLILLARFPDDWFNKKKRQFSQTKLKVKTYLAYGIKAKRAQLA